MKFIVSIEVEEESLGSIMATFAKQGVTIVGVTPVQNIRKPLIAKGVKKSSSKEIDGNYHKYTARQIFENMAKKNDGVIVKSDTKKVFIKDGFSDTAFYKTIKILLNEGILVETTEKGIYNYIGE